MYRTSSSTRKIAPRLPLAKASMVLRNPGLPFPTKLRHQSSLTHRFLPRIFLVLDAEKAKERVGLGLVAAICAILEDKIARRRVLDVQSAAVRALRMSALKVPNRPTDAAGRQHAEALDVIRDLLQVRCS